MKQSEIKSVLSKIIVIIVHPFLLFPVLIKDNFKGKYIHITLGLMAGVLGFAFEPGHENFDLYRRYVVYESFNNSFEMMEYKDFYYPLMVYIYNKLYLSKYFMGATSAFILYYYNFKILSILKKNRKLKKNIVWHFIYLIFFSFLFYTGLRYAVGLIIYIFGIFILEKNRKKIGYAYILLSPFFHIALTIPVILYIFINIILHKMENKNFLNFLLILSLIVGYKNLAITLVEYLRVITQSLPGDFFQEISSKIYFYTDNKYGLNYAEEALAGNSLATLRYEITKILRVLIMFTYCYFEKTNTKFNRYIKYMVIFSFLFMNFHTFYSRLSLIPQYFILTELTFDKNLKLEKLNIKRMILYLLIFLLIFLRFFELKHNFGYFFESYINVLELSPFYLWVTAIFNKL